MGLTDRKIHPDSAVAKKSLRVPVVTSTSLTDRCVLLHKPGHAFRVDRVSVFSSALAGTVTVDVLISPASGPLTAGALAIDAVPEKFQIALGRYLIGGQVVEKAPATALTFSAGHVVSAGKWGAILVQIGTNGAISTKVATSPQAALSRAAALAALPAADAGKLAIGAIVIQAGGADWTANTDDLTDGSDLATAEFLRKAAPTRITGAGLAPVALAETEATMPASLASRLGGPSDYLVGLVTTDGSGALTNGQLAVGYRPRPLNGEA
jgi:hypothetical protein